MEIIKIFSDQYDDERLYSVLMSEEELDFLQREFAFKDYEGLTEAQAEALRKRRSEYAKELKKVYRKTQGDVTNLQKKLGNSLSDISTVGTVRGGGVKTAYEAASKRGSDLTSQGFARFHMDSVTDQLLDGSSKAKDIMRKDVEKNVKGLGKAGSKNPSMMRRAGNWMGRNKLATAAIGTAAAAGLGYGAYKLAKRKKKED